MADSSSISRSVGAQDLSHPKIQSIVLTSLKTAFGGSPIKPPALLEVIGFLLNLIA
jgi:hypothetical protein